jgi:hypothetical protein
MVEPLCVLAIKSIINRLSLNNQETIYNNLLKLYLIKESGIDYGETLHIQASSESEAIIKLSRQDLIRKNEVLYDGYQNFRITNKIYSCTICHYNCNIHYDRKNNLCIICDDICNKHNTPEDLSDDDWIIVTQELIRDYIITIQKVENIIY